MTEMQILGSLSVVALGLISFTGLRFHQRLQKVEDRQDRMETYLQRISADVAVVKNDVKWVIGRLKR